MIIKVVDLNHEGLKCYARLTEAQLRNRLEPEKGIFIAESPKVIKVALQAGCIPLSLLMEERQLEGQGGEIVSLCGDVPVYVGDRDLLAQLTGYELTRGVLCAMQRPHLPTPEEICRQGRRIAIIDSVVNSTNTGAIFRAAASLGMDGVLLTPSCCDPLNRRFQEHPDPFDQKKILLPSLFRLILQVDHVPDAAVRAAGYNSFLHPSPVRHASSFIYTPMLIFGLQHLLPSIHQIVNALLTLTI